MTKTKEEPKETRPKKTRLVATTTIESGHGRFVEGDEVDLPESELKPLLASGAVREE